MVHTEKLSGRDHENREPTLRREQHVRSEDLSGELQGAPEGCQPTEAKDDAEARRDFWSIQCDFIYRHHIEPRVQLYVPKEESFLIPLKHIEVTRATFSNLDVLQEKRIDDYWNVDAHRNLSDSLKGITKFTLLKAKSLKGKIWSGERPTKIQTTTRPENLWPEVWSKMGKAAQKREKQEWANEKEKLDDARRLRGIYFIDPEDGAYKETIKNARKKLEVSVGAAVPFKKEQRSTPGFRKLKGGVTNPTRFQRQSMHA